MPNFDCFEQYNPSIGLNYFVEPQKDSYSRSRPPLKSDFESKEAADKWLKEYLKEPEKHRYITNKELAMWLAQGNGLATDKSTGRKAASYSYREDDNERVDYICAITITM